MVKIRLLKKGRVNRPIFTLVATDSRSPRDGRFLARLGQYDPFDQENPMRAIKSEEIKGWLNKGAQLSDSLKSLFRKYKVQISL